MDGKTRGYWNPGVTRKSGLSTDVVTLDDDETARRVRELANYSGPVFMRTPTGDAYQANVDVTGADATSSVMMSFALDAQKLACTDFLIETEEEEE